MKKVFTRFLKIYNQIDSTSIHQKFTNEKSMKLATILNRFFYYIEYVQFLIYHKNIKNFNYFRYNLIISIARNSMDLFNVYEYFGEHKISPEEYELRELCSNYHETLNREKMDQKLREYNKEKFNQFNIIFPSCNYENRIKENKIYLNSTEKWQQSLLSARKCYYFSRIQTKMNILPHAFESVLYNLFSNYVHSFELGLGYDFNRGNSSMFSGYDQALLAIEIMKLYGAILLKDYISRRHLKKYIEKDDLLFLDTLIQYDTIESKIKEWKDKFDIYYI